MKKREPNFDNFLKVLNRQKPDRPTAYELFMNDVVYERFAGYKRPEGKEASMKYLIDAFANGGYDYFTVGSVGFHFKLKERRRLKSLSLNESVIITNREEYEAYEWPVTSDFSREPLEMAARLMPDLAANCPWEIPRSTRTRLSALTTLREKA